MFQCMELCSKGIPNNIFYSISCAPPPDHHPGPPRLIGMTVGDTSVASLTTNRPKGR
jgi:hypothetical protein